jgi:hypothetical protein
MSSNQHEPGSGQKRGSTLLGRKQDKQAAKQAASQDVHEQSPTEAFDEEGAGIAPKE